MEKAVEFYTLEKGILALKDQIDALAETDDLGKTDRVAALRREIDQVPVRFERPRAGR